MRKICVVSGYRSDYTKLFSVLKSIQNHKDLDLQIVAIGAHSLDDYGKTITSIEKDFKVDVLLETNIEGSTPSSMSKSVGLCVIELTSAFKLLKPDVVLIVGDRFEVFGAAVAATMSSIPLAHIQGGEISGTIDETIRHTITKLSHIHFPSTEKSAERIIRLGENPDFVFNVGCPAYDYIKNLNLEDYKKIYGDYVIIIQHPDVLDYKNANLQMTATLHAVYMARKRAFLFYPNPDPGSVEMIRAIRNFEDQFGKQYFIEKYKNVDFKFYINLLAGAECIVGNSSSGIREAYAVKTPAVNIGDRQKDREHAGLVLNCTYDARKISSLIREAIDKSKNFDYNSSIFGDGTAGQRIAAALAQIKLQNILNKRITI